MIKKQIIIFFVKDQNLARSFYQVVLACEPSLDVPGMTEFNLGTGLTLGIMPEAGIRNLLGNRYFPAVEHRKPAAELYLTVDDPEGCLERAIRQGAELILPVQTRDWGDRAGYCLTPDNHILAFSKPLADTDIHS